MMRLEVSSARVLLAILLVGLGTLGLCFPPTLPDAPESIGVAFVLSTAYAAMIGTGLFAPFGRKVRGGLLGIVVMLLLWSWNALV